MGTERPKWLGRYGKEWSSKNIWENRGKKILLEAQQAPILSLRHFSQQQFERFGKSSCVGTIRRILRRGNMVWKRLRKSLKKCRDEALFQYFKAEIEILKKQAKEKQIDLCYFDATGLNLTPNVPYGWQKIGTTAVLPAQRTKGVTILGILNPLHNSFKGYRYQGAANAACVIQALDDFADTLNKKTVLILDNASIHKAKVVKDQFQKWRSKGLFLQFIPAYSPELNLIEILWKQLKHYWLKPQHYSSMDALTHAADSILNQFGELYTISFG